MTELSNFSLKFILSLNNYNIIKMNIASIVVKILPKNSEHIIQILKNSDFCEYQLYDEKGRIIVTVEAEGISGEIASLKQIKKIPMVISAEVVYSYSEHELEAEREKMEIKEPVAPWLNDENVDVNDIKYSGDLRRKDL